MTEAGKKGERKSGIRNEQLGIRKAGSQEGRKRKGGEERGGIINYKEHKDYKGDVCKGE